MPVGICCCEVKIAKGPFELSIYSLVQPVNTAMKGTISEFTLHSAS